MKHRDDVRKIKFCGKEVIDNIYDNPELIKPVNEF